jgi:membrane protease YdiL (CAAX protease family)
VIKVQPTRWPGLAWALGLLALAFAAQAGAAWVWVHVGGVRNLTLLAGLANLTALVPVAVLGFWFSGEPPAFTPPTPIRARFWLGLLLAATGGTAVLGELANLMAWLVPLPPELANLFNQVTLGPPLISLFTLAVVAPLTEEILFRGLFLRAFARRYGIWPALVLSSALFAFFHLNVWQALAAVFAGLYLGHLCLSSGSLWPPMVAHAWFNGLPVALAAIGLTVDGYNSPNVAGAASFQPWPWVAGGALLLGAGLVLTKRWAPLPPPPVSDTVVP